MRSEEWNAWLRSWLSRHPLRTPPAGFERQLRQDVLARIRGEQATVRTIRWTLQPRWSFALGGALAAALVAGILILPGRLANHTPDPVMQEAASGDRLVLADASTELEQDLELLDLLEEEQAEPEELESIDDEVLLEELRRMDEAEMAVS